MEQIAMDLSKWKVSSDAGAITSLSKKKDGIEVDFTTKDQKEGYYTAFIYQEPLMAFGKHSAAILDVRVTKDTWLNCNLVLSDGTVITGDENSMIRLQSHSDATISIAYVNNGTVKIPAGFDGTVTIPYKLPENQKGTLGFITVLPQEQQNTFLVRSLTLGKQKKTAIVTGPDLIEIPVRGEYSYRYACNSENAVFSLKEETEGVKLSEDGTLVIQNGADPQSILILCEIAGKETYQYNVTLAESWFASEDAKEQMIFGIPVPQQVVTYEPKMKRWNQICSKASYGRTAVLLIIVSYLLFYRFLVRKR